MVHSAAYQPHELFAITVGGIHTIVNSVAHYGWTCMQLAELFIVFDLLCMRAVVLRIGFVHLSISQSVSQ